MTRTKTPKIDPWSAWDEMTARLSGAHATVTLSAVELMAAIGMAADDWQVELLTSTASKTLGLTTRQAGKTLGVSAKVLELACQPVPEAHPDGVIVVFSPSFRQSARVIRRARALHRLVSRKTRLPALLNRDPAMMLIEGGTPVIALPDNPDGVRGETALALVGDEAAFVLRPTWDAVMPMLAASKGQLWAISSAGIEGSQMHELWLDVSAPSIARIEVPWQKAPRINREFIESERRRMTAERFAMEYGCRWGQSAGAVFDVTAWKSAATSGIEELVLPPFEEAA